jgi:hypothetical protein
MTTFVHDRESEQFTICGAHLWQTNEQHVSFHAYAVTA